MTDWKTCRKILCVRADNMGDLIMSGPAIRAVKETFQASVTVLTSSQAARIAPFMPAVDDVIIADLPWVKHKEEISDEKLSELAAEIRSYDFDAAIIFSVYSQSILPTALLLCMAGVPRRLAYCRENPYQLLTDWYPDPEPYNMMRHQVQRDLALVEMIGARTSHIGLTLEASADAWPLVVDKLRHTGVHMDKPWVIVHTGVSELKREYPRTHWRVIVEMLTTQFDCQVLLTGAADEAEAIAERFHGITINTFNLAGLLTLHEFILLIRHAAVVVTVNTSTSHIAAAVQAPLVVLYALSNPQHLPWKAKGVAFFYNVAEAMQSRNEVIRYVTDRLMIPAGMPEPGVVVSAIGQLLSDSNAEMIPEMAPLLIDRQQ